MDGKPRRTFWVERDEEFQEYPYLAYAVIKGAAKFVGNYASEQKALLAAQIERTKPQRPSLMV